MVSVLRPRPSRGYERPFSAFRGGFESRFIRRAAIAIACIQTPNGDFNANETAVRLRLGLECRIWQPASGGDGPGAWCCDPVRRCARLETLMPVRISVAMATYNGEAFLGDQLRSIATQGA